MLGNLFAITPTFPKTLEIMETLKGEELVKLVGKQIKKFRKEQKMTQFDLSVKSNMEENALQRIETGRTNASLKTLLKIVNALEIEFKNLFEFPNEGN